MDGNGGGNGDGNNNKDRAGGAPEQTATTFAFGTIEQLHCQHQEMQQGQEQTENVRTIMMAGATKDMFFGGEMKKKRNHHNHKKKQCRCSKEV